MNVTNINNINKINELNKLSYDEKIKLQSLTFGPDFNH